MSSETSSNPSSNASSSSQSNKRTRRVQFEETTSTATKPSPPSTVDKQPTALEAATAEATAFVVTLHPALQSHATYLIKQLLTKYSAYFYKLKNNSKTSTDPSYVSRSVTDNVKLTLQAVPEVSESEDFKTLNAALAEEISSFHRRLTTAYVLEVNRMNCNALHKRFHVEYAKLLPSMARGFIAEQGIENYSGHQAVVDSVATDPDEVLNVLKCDLRSFFRTYKEANEIAVLPTPAVKEDNVLAIINEINGPPPAEARDSQQQQQTSTATEQAGAAGTTTASTSATANSREDIATTLLNGVSEQELLNNNNISTPSAQQQQPPRGRGRGTLNSSSSASSGGPSPLQPRIIEPSPDQPNNTESTAAGSTSGTQDEVMEDADTSSTSRTNPFITGGTKLVIEDLLSAVKYGITRPIEKFTEHDKKVDIASRIKRATKPPALNDAAARITAAVQRERPQAPTVLRGLIQEESAKTTTELKRRLQSVEAQLDNEKKKNQASSSSSSSKKGKGGGKASAAAKQSKKNNNAAKKSPQGSANASTAGRGNNKKSPSNNKSSGKKKGSNKSKRK